MRAPSTPCVNICLLDSRTGLCAGCGRTTDEIVRWSDISEAERLALMDEARARLAQAQVPEKRI
jgi:uncharacterized protein